MPYSIGVVGGTGPQGKGLAYRFALAGHHVTLGSRSVQRAEEAAGELRRRINDRVGAGHVVSGENTAACDAADIVVLAVPYDGHDDLVTGLPLAGRIVISCVNPLVFDKGGASGLPIDGGLGSAAESAQRLAPAARVVGAFHHVSAVSLLQEGLLSDEDVLVVGDDVEAKAVVMDLASCVTGRPGVDAGKLRLARQLEPLTAVLISINRRYKVHSGVKVAGLP